MRLSQSQIRWLSGFGGVSGGAAYAVSPTSIEEIQDAVRTARELGKSIVLRGSGRSYGDASYLPEAIALDLSQFKHLEMQGSVLVAGGGATIAEVWRYSLPQGYWPPVVSGTAHPTLSGALAMNIHGKNAHSAGTLGEHLAWIKVVDGRGEVHIFEPHQPAFWGFVSGMGLSGVIAEVGLNMHPVKGPWLDVTAVSVPTLRAQFEVFEKHRTDWDYMVSWLDLYGGGRGLFHAAKYADDHTPLQLTEARSLLKANLWRAMKMFTNPLGTRLINQMKFMLGKRESAGGIHRQDLPAFSFLLDSIPNWQRAYGKRGFLQFQVFAPVETAPKLFQDLIDLQRRSHHVAYLAVMKRHRAAPGILTYSLDGYSLAMDFPNHLDREVFRQLMESMIAATLDHGGKFYGAKDQLLNSAQFARMHGESALRAFRAHLSEWDPDGIFDSALARRLQLRQPSIL